MSRRRLIAALFSIVAFVLNPAFLSGCLAPSESEPSFGEAEMLALLATANDKTWVHGDREIELSLKQGAQLLARVEPGHESSWLRSATACSNREFVATAAACVDITTMAVAGTDVLVDNAEVSGRMEVFGLLLSNVSLELQHAQGSLTFKSSDGVAFTLEQLIEQAM